MKPEALFSEMKDDLDEYLSLKGFAENTTKKLITDLKEAIELMGTSNPSNDDLQVYKDKLACLEKNGKTKYADKTIKNKFSVVKNFFEYRRNKNNANEEIIGSVSENDKADEKTSNDTPKESIMEQGNEVIEDKKTRRFSLLVPPSMFDTLELLSKYDNCSVAQVILHACDEYIVSRDDDINYMLDMQNRLEQRKANKK